MILERTLGAAHLSRRKELTMKRSIRYINIAEARHLYLFGGKPFMEVTRSAGIHEQKNGKTAIRSYQNVSDASILRLAKIQEKLAK